MLPATPKRRRGRPRKPQPRHDSVHRTRPALARSTPVHVVLRCKVRQLRTRRVYRELRRVVARYVNRAEFHITHFSIQTNHLHLIVEAENRTCLARGMQSFAIRAARAIQRALEIRGKVFAFRYHATQIEGYAQARRTISYVLNNWRHHGQDLLTPLTRSWLVDPFSSGATFTGWKRQRLLPPPDEPLVMTEPRTSLLADTWKLCGLIDPTERPGMNF